MTAPAAVPFDAPRQVMVRGICQDEQTCDHWLCRTCEELWSDLHACTCEYDPRTGERVK